MPCTRRHQAPYTGGAVDNEDLLREKDACGVGFVANTKARLRATAEWETACDSEPPVYTMCTVTETVSQSWTLLSAASEPSGFGALEMSRSLLRSPQRLNTLKRNPNSFVQNQRSHTVVTQALTALGCMVSGLGLPGWGCDLFAQAASRPRFATAILKSAPSSLCRSTVVGAAPTTTLAMALVL